MNRNHLKRYDTRVCWAAGQLAVLLMHALLSASWKVTNTVLLLPFAGSVSPTLQEDGSVPCLACDHRPEGALQVSHPTVDPVLPKGTLAAEFS